MVRPAATWNGSLCASSFSWRAGENRARPVPCQTMAFVLLDAGLGGDELVRRGALHGRPAVAQAMDFRHEEEGLVLDRAARAGEFFQEVEVAGLDLLVAVEQAIAQTQVAPLVVAEMGRERHLAPPVAERAGEAEVERIRDARFLHATLPTGLKARWTTWRSSAKSCGFVRYSYTPRRRASK